MFDYWDEIDKAMAWPSLAERARTAFDLAIVSVLLDAGAGPGWKFVYPVSGETVSRSEGLALASLVMFRNCEFSQMAELSAAGRRGDAGRSSPKQSSLAGFQVRKDNPLHGVAGRVATCCAGSAGRHRRASRRYSAATTTPRPGGLFDHLAALAREQAHRGAGRSSRSCSRISGRSGRRG